MSLVFRTDQTTPLTNDQVDNNFKYLRDQINAKYNTADLTASNISLKLRTTTGLQTQQELTEANAINAWLVRDLVPSSTMPSVSNKQSLVARDSSGDIYVGTVHGAVIGNATSATLATSALKLTTPVNINGVAFDGSASVTVADSTKLPLAGGTMTGKLNLVNSAYLYAPLNLGAAAPDQNSKVNGDVWATTDGVYYHINNITHQIASVESPTFTGIPRAPGYTGGADQISTLSHLNNTQTVLQSGIDAKAPINSPSFAGTPLAPTPDTSSNDTRISTTAFVKTTVNNKATELTSNYTTYTNNAIINLSNTTNSALATKANLNSPVFTGTPLSPTAQIGDNSSQIANTAFVNSALATMQANLNAAVSALNDAIASTRPLPVGAVMFMPSSVVPYGFLEANGQAVSKTTYADLWAYLGSPATQQGDANGTFRVPDYRGEFIRGWDHGRGIDTNRGLGTVQYSQNLEHNHGMPGDDQLSFANGTGGWTGTSRGTFPYDAHSSYGGGGQIWNTTTDGGSESRPRNVALMPVIKY